MPSRCSKSTQKTPERDQLTSFGYIVFTLYTYNIYTYITHWSIVPIFNIEHFNCFLEIFFVSAVPITYKNMLKFMNLRFSQNNTQN